MKSISTPKFIFITVFAFVLSFSPMISFAQTPTSSDRVTMHTNFQKVLLARKTKNGKVQQQVFSISVFSVNPETKLISRELTQYVPNGEHRLFFVRFQGSANKEIRYSYFKKASLVDQTGDNRSIKEFLYHRSRNSGWVEPGLIVSPNTDYLIIPVYCDSLGLKKATVSIDGVSSVMSVVCK